MGAEHAALVSGARAEISDIVSGKDDRLLVVVGPCSIHDTGGGARLTRESSSSRRTTIRKSSSS